MPPQARSGSDYGGPFSYERFAKEAREMVRLKEQTYEEEKRAIASRGANAIEEALGKYDELQKRAAKMASDLMNLANHVNAC